MRRLLAMLLVMIWMAGVVLAEAGLEAADAPSTVPTTAPVERVKLSLEYKVQQPAGAPLVVRVTLTNTGSVPIDWWCGGPARYPPAEHFLVEAVLPEKDGYVEVTATNGQYTQGSGYGEVLKPGESIEVPLAIPEVASNYVVVRVRPRTWNAEAAVEASVSLEDRRSLIDDRRALMIRNALAEQSEPFLQHLAEQYADDVVRDAMLRLVAIDNAPIAARAARVLARQESLPESAGPGLAAAVRRWLPTISHTDWQEFYENTLEAALKTRSESARAAVLQVLRELEDARAAVTVINALRLSPGDAAWRERVRAAIAAVPEEKYEGEEVARMKKVALEWMESRLRWEAEVGE